MAKAISGVISVVLLGLYMYAVAVVAQVAWVESIWA